MVLFNLLIKKMCLVVVYIKKCEREGVRVRGKELELYFGNDIS